MCGRQPAMGISASALDHGPWAMAHQSSCIPLHHFLRAAPGGHGRKIAISVEHDNTATLYSEEGARSADWRLDTLYRVHYNTGLA